MVSPDRDKTGTPHGRFLADTPKYGEISSLSGPDGRFWADLAPMAATRFARLRRARDRH
jgi:hypothetical protein